MADESDGTGGAEADLRRRHDDFVRDISHDVRNPLQVILLQAERLQRLLPESAARERKAAAAIAAAVRQLEQLIKARVRQARGEEPAEEAGRIGG